MPRLCPNRTAGYACLSLLSFDQPCPAVPTAHGAADVQVERRRSLSPAQAFYRTVNAIGAERPGHPPRRRYHPAEPRRQGWSWIARRAPLVQPCVQCVSVGACPDAGRGGPPPPCGRVEIAEGRPEALTRRRPSRVRELSVLARTKASSGSRRPARRAASRVTAIPPAATGGPLRDASWWVRSTLPGLLVPSVLQL